MSVYYPDNHSMEETVEQLITRFHRQMDHFTIITLGDERVAMPVPS